MSLGSTGSLPPPGRMERGQGVSERRRIILLNAFPLNAFPQQRFSARFERVGVQQLVNEVSAADAERAEVVNYIRHPATVSAISRALSRELRPEAGFYSYREGDIVYVVTVKQLPARGVEVTTVRVEELDIVRVEVSSQ